uniref:Chondroadherin-like protein n=1 Tax=Oncorhynchus tshawytscha TaxID=74940 RepID=A0AAZ3RU48_ONCTS
AQLLHSGTIINRPYTSLSRKLYKAIWEGYILKALDVKFDKFNHKVKLDLSKNGIQVLPTHAILQIPHLTLQRCNIRAVREGAFRTLGHLVSLNLANNNIEILYQESFDGLSSLKQLTLDHNRVEEIQPGAFTQLGFLNMLSLTHNQLVYIPNMAFQGLHNIKWLRLSRNSLNNLAMDAFAGLFTVTSLSLDELHFFPTQTMTRLAQVTCLDLSYNPMAYLGEDTVSMPKLTHLYLDHMSLQDFADTAMSQATLLSHLDLSHNQLRYLEPLSGPMELARLNLTGNPIHCNCYPRPLKEWAKKGKVKLIGVCAGPRHLSDEAVGPMELRCRSREDMIKEELKDQEESRERALPTAKPKKKSKCPDNCDCDVKA